MSVIAIFMLPFLYVFYSYAKKSYQHNGFDYIFKHLFLISLLFAAEFFSIRIISSAVDEIFITTTMKNILILYCVIANLFLLDKYKTLYAGE